METTELIIQAGRIAVPALFSLSLFIFLVQFISDRQAKAGTVELESLLGDINVYEVAGKLELSSDKAKRERAKLDAWSRFWLNSYERSGNYSSDLKAPGKRVLYGILGAALVGFLIGRLMGLIVAIPITILFLWAKNATAAQVRNTKMDTQLLTLAQSMEQNLAAGSIPTDAFLRAIDDIPNPLRSELMIVANDVQAGKSFTDALAELGDRHESREMKFFAAALSVSIERGADLQGQLRTIGEKIERRKALREKIAEIVAQNKGLIYIVGGSVPAAIIAAELGLVGGSADGQRASWMDSPVTITVLIGILILWGFGMGLAVKKIADTKKF